MDCNDLRADSLPEPGPETSTLRFFKPNSFTLLPTSSAAINNAKRKRVGIYALNAMAKVFGSEEEAWESLAEQAKQSFPHLKLLFEYKYGKPLDKPEEKQQKVNINIKNLFTGSQEEDNTIELDNEEASSE